MIAAQSTCNIHSRSCVAFGAAGEIRSPSRTSRTVRREQPRVRAISRRPRPLTHPPPDLLVPVHPHAAQTHAVFFLVVVHEGVRQEHARFSFPKVQRQTSVSGIGRALLERAWRPEVALPLFPNSRNRVRPIPPNQVGPIRRNPAIKLSDEFGQYRLSIRCNDYGNTCLCYLADIASKVG
jgi:hypothetical protein